MKGAGGDLAIRVGGVRIRWELDDGRCRGVGVLGCLVAGIGIEKVRKFLINVLVAEEGSFDCPGGDDDGLWVRTAIRKMEEDADAVWDDLYELTMNVGVV